MTTPAYYKDNVPYDASGQAIITITGDKPQPRLSPIWVMAISSSNRSIKAVI